MKKKRKEKTTKIIFQIVSKIIFLNYYKFKEMILPYTVDRQLNATYHSFLKSNNGHLCSEVKHGLFKRFPAEKSKMHFNCGSKTSK